MNKKIILYFSALLTFFSYFVFAENTISLQGRVLDKNGNPLNGDYSFKIRFCDSQVGGLIDFERTVDFVEVKDGFYSIEISTSASFDKEYWVEIGVKPQGSQDNYEFFPRYKLTSSPYAIRSNYSEYAKYTTGFVSTSAISMGGYPILDVSTMSVGFIISTSPATTPLVISTSVYIVGYASATKFYGDGSNLTGVIDKECRLSTGTLVTLSSTQTITAAKTFTSSVTIRNVLEARQLFVSTISVSGANFYKVVESSFVFLLYCDETAQSDTTTGSTQTIKSCNISFENCDSIIVESEVRGEPTSGSDSIYIWSIKLDNDYKKTIYTWVGNGSNERWAAVFPLKVVIPVSQSSGTISITGYMDNGTMTAYSLRVYGVKKLKLLVAE